MAKNEDDKNHDNVTKFPGSARDRQAWYQKKQLKDMPFYDDKIRKPKSEPMFNLPPVTQNIALLLAAVHVIILFLPAELRMQIIFNLSFVPARYTGQLPFDIFAIISPVTHMALHSGWMHIIVNVGMLMAFGSGVEKVMGGKRMLILMLTSGVIGAATHFVFYFDSPYSLLGASGGISGLFAAMLVLMSGQGQGQGSDKKRLLILVAVWIGISLLFGMMGAPGIEGNIAWTTHIGGFFAGLGLSYYWLGNRRGKIK